MDWDVTIWRHFRVEAPSGWELLRYSRNPAQGQCVFVDRYRARLEMHWRRVSGAPDTERMLSDYAARLKDEGVRKLNRVSLAGWDGLVGRQDGRPVSRFGRYFSTEGCCLELVFPWPEVREEAIERRILSAVAEEPARGGTRRWRAFGLDMAVPEHLELESCSRHAARAEFIFSAARGVELCRFMQLGMVPSWLDKPVSQWLSAHVPVGLRVEQEATTAVDGRERVYLRGRLGRWCRGLHWRGPVYEASAGLGPDGRLYLAAHRGVRAVGPLALPFNRRDSALDERSSGGFIRVAPSPASEGEAWGAMLQAVPLRNAAARVERNDDGTVRVHVAKTPEKSLRAPLSWIVPVRRETRIVLENRGVAVWELCDGRRTVECMAEVFAARHGLTFHEARLSVAGYLKELIQRGVLAIQLRPAGSGGAGGL